MTWPVPVIGFAAYSGTGKTTLLKAVLPRLRARGLRIGMIKHAHHQFDIDKPGKDSYELRRAGAQHMLVASSRRWALMVEREVEQPPRLEDHLATLIDSGPIDLVLVEGFKQAPIPKIELHRSALGHPLLFPGDPLVIAVASDTPLILPDHVRALDIDDPDGVAAFLLERLEEHGRARA
ncbi:MAG: hypothetical protein KatS3mg121_0422 [Gammaproteobacteria bacterium]|nr:MAG: hypothetical protein KatS3mg121_0422 [Gammaproteobacteria bacterium]